MKYYVYVLITIPDKVVCYIGKGQNKRMYVHKRNLHSSQTVQLGLYRRLRELIESGKDFKPVKIFETNDEEAAFIEERRLIELYGFDNLFNSTTICGPTQNDWTVARRQAISKALKERAAKNRLLYGKGLPPKTIAKLVAKNRGQKRPTTSLKLKQLHVEGKWIHCMSKWQKAGVNAWRGKTHSTKSKRKIGKARLGCHLSLETKLKISKSERLTKANKTEL